MDDSFWPGKPSLLIWSSQPGHPSWVDAVNTGNGYGHHEGRKWQVLLLCWPSCLDAGS